MVDVKKEWFDLRDFRNAIDASKGLRKPNYNAMNAHKLLGYLYAYLILKSGTRIVVNLKCTGNLDINLISMINDVNANCQKEISSQFNKVLAIAKNRDDKFWSTQSGTNGIFRGGNVSLKDLSAEAEFYFKSIDFIDEHKNEIDGYCLELIESATKSIKQHPQSYVIPKILDYINLDKLKLGLDIGQRANLGAQYLVLPMELIMASRAFGYATILSIIKSLESKLHIHLFDKLTLTRDRLNGGNGEDQLQINFKFKGVDGTDYSFTFWLFPLLDVLKGLSWAQTNNTNFQSSNRKDFDLNLNEPEAISWFRNNLKNLYDINKDSIGAHGEDCSLISGTIYDFNKNSEILDFRSIAKCIDKWLELTSFEVEKE